MEFHPITELTVGLFLNEANFAGRPIGGEPDLIIMLTVCGGRSTRFNNFVI